ncbi:MAG TPA: type I methionyl aminopeptidase [Thermodesulfobacteriota bacterium]|nr:type I methionyl aminopeptidase [Thermodesulfobacteriota bacterium]
MEDKLASMLEANRITHIVLSNCKKLILNAESITAAEVNQYAEFSLTRFGVQSAFKGVNNFPAVMCISINDGIVHGLPTEDVKIVKGDVVSLDFGVKYNGYCSDAAITFLNGKVSGKGSRKKNKLIKDTEKALNDCIKVLEENFPNCKLSDICKVLDSYSNKYGLVKGYGGHRIGKTLHEPGLFVPNNWSNLYEDRDLKIGDFFTIEPMFTLGADETKVGEDGFTVKTIDGSIAAHFEYSIAITEKGIIVLK